MNASEGIDPEVVAAMVAAGAPPGLEQPTPGPELVEALRAQLPPYDATPAAGVRRDELVLPGPPGAPEVPVRVHRRTSRAAAQAPGIVWLHGGGLIAGTYDMDAAFLDRLVARTGCVAVTVEYRLAPETRYPGALDDCFAALAYLYERGVELGVDPARLAVGGYSAGAGLAAACALLAREREIPLVHQHLVYPMLDDRQVTPSSRWDGLALWSREMSAYAWQCYLGELHGTDAVPALAAPARADDLAGLPPAYLHVGSLDGFLHEDVDYALRLAAAGVPVELHVLPRVPHGFDFVAPDAAVTRTANALSDAVLDRALG